MSEKKPISAEAFRNKATRIIEIDGFEEGEKIAIRIKPVSLLAMMTNGRLPNELKTTVASLFASGKGAKANKVEMDEVEEIALMQQLMDQVCKDAMVEPLYEDVAEILNDVQKTQVFTATQNGLQELKPTDEE